MCREGSAESHFHRDSEDSLVSRSCFIIWCSYPVSKLNLDEFHNIFIDFKTDNSFSVPFNGCVRVVASKFNYWSKIQVTRSHFPFLCFVLVVGLYHWVQLGRQLSVCQLIERVENGGLQPVQPFGSCKLNNELHSVTETLRVGAPDSCHTEQ